MTTTTKILSGDTWPKVEVRTRVSSKRPWSKWQTIAAVKEITAAKALCEWYQKVDPGGLESRVVIWPF